MLKTEKGSGRGGQNEKFGFCKVNLSIWRTIFIWPFRGAHIMLSGLLTRRFFIYLHIKRVCDVTCFLAKLGNYMRENELIEMLAERGGKGQSIKDNSCCCWLLTATCAGRAEINAGSAA